MGNSVSIRLPDEITARLEKLAEKTDKSKSYYIRRILEEFLDEFEDAYTALERLNDKHATFLSTDEVKKSLGV
ncbi:MAG: DUF6290 family protein [Candidatus Wallbacteria bacterium]|nr:DUF6290 family protein [Candidatus Wallbacteria bacterium]